MPGKAIFIDTTRCTACRGCQVACKQWNKLAALTTTQTGTHQNPPDFSFETYKVVRFKEHKGEKGQPVWYFFSDQCRHCLEPPCMEAAVEGQGVEGSIRKDESTGAVIYSELTKKLKFDEIRSSCPYDIPRQNAKSTVIAKCTMCIDRIQNGLQPACVKSCPTQSMNFGDLEAMLKLAEERLNTVKTKFPQAQLTNTTDVRVFYLVAEDPKKYHEFADASGALGISRKTALRKMLGPVKALLHA